MIVPAMMPPMSISVHAPGSAPRAIGPRSETTDVRTNHPITTRRNHRRAMRRRYQAPAFSRNLAAGLAFLAGGCTARSASESARTIGSLWSARPSTYSASSRSPVFMACMTASLAKSNEFTSAVSGDILSTRPSQRNRKKSTTKTTYMMATAGWKK